MNDYRTRTKVNTAVLIREQIGNLSPGDDLAKLIRDARRNLPAGDPTEPEREGLLKKLLTIITGRKRKP